jgi:hypothetical protein
VSGGSVSAAAPRSGADCINATGNIKISGNASLKSEGSQCWVIAKDGSNGVIEISDNAIVEAIGSSSSAIYADDGTITINMTGGTLKASGEGSVIFNMSSTATADVTGGTLITGGGSVIATGSSNNALLIGNNVTILEVPTITTTDLPDGTRYAAYSVTLSAIGTSPITWTLDSGSLPDGLTLSSSGAITGTPTVTGTSIFTVKAANGDLSDATKELSIEIKPEPPKITTNKLPAGVIGTAYYSTLTAIGSPPFTWTLYGGSLPDGLNLNPSTGAITGTPTAIESPFFTVQAADESLQTGTRYLSIAVYPETTPGAIQDLVTTINAYDPDGWGEDYGPGLLTATSAGGIVTVTGNVTGASFTLNLDIPYGVTVRWTASLTGSVYDKLIWKSGPGTLEVIEGGVFSNEGDHYNTIYCSKGDVVVSGGSISGNGTNHFAINNDNDGDIIVLDGSVTANGQYSRAISSHGNGDVSVSGGNVSATGNNSYTIQSNVRGDVIVSGGTLSASGEDSLIFHMEGEATAEVTGGTLIISSGAGLTDADSVNSVTIGNNVNILDITPTLTGAAIISGTNAIGQILTVDTSGLSGVSSGAFSYQWKSDGQNVSTGTASYVLQGSDAGKIITCEVSHADASGSVTATFDSGLEVPYNITIASKGVVAGDTAVTLSSAAGRAGDIISLSYVLGSGSGTDTDTSTNILTFSGGTGLINLTAAGINTSQDYTVNASDVNQQTGVIAITATFAHSVLTVTPPQTEAPKSKDSITAAKIPTPPGGKADLPKTVDFGGGYISDVTWKSSNNSIAKIDENGDLVGVGEGTATLTATSVADPGKTISITVTIAKNVTKIRSQLQTLYLKKGKALTPPVDFDGKDAKGKAWAYKGYGNAPKLTWTSSKPKIAKVNPATGKITPLKKGTAKITATALNGIKYTFTVKVVTKTTKLKKLTLIKPPKTIKSGQTKILKVKLTPGKATNQKVTFKSKKTAVLKVDKAGKLYAIKKGTAKITVKSGGKSKVITVVVK